MDLELRKRVAHKLRVQESDLVWSELSNNPETQYHHEDGTIKGEQGYWVLSQRYLDFL